jgi:hypothetical protein
MKHLWIIVLAATALGCKGTQASNDKPAPAPPPPAAKAEEPAITAPAQAPTVVPVANSGEFCCCVIGGEDFEYLSADTRASCSDQCVDWGQCKFSGTKVVALEPDKPLELAWDDERPDGIVWTSGHTNILMRTTLRDDSGTLEALDHTTTWRKLVTFDVNTAAGGGMSLETRGDKLLVKLRVEYGSQDPGALEAYLFKYADDAKGTVKTAKKWRGESMDDPPAWAN